jgi:adenine-specific DNA-methyltransferase
MGVPFDYPDDWASEVQALLQAFHTARQKMQAEMDRIHRSAMPKAKPCTTSLRETKNKLRVIRPVHGGGSTLPHRAFTGRACDERTAGTSASMADMSVARSGHTSRQHAWRDELLKTGIRGKGGQMLKFAELEVLPGTTCLHASGHLDTASGWW